jgi:PhnB protein
MDGETAMQVTPYLNFDGQCAEAFELPARLFDGKITFMMTFGESPMAETEPVETHGAIMHATVELPDGQQLQGSDAPGGRYNKPAGFAVAVALDDAGKAHAVFKELAKGGVETMAIQETFWAKAFGMVTDRFGIPWMINVNKPMS